MNTNETAIYAVDARRRARIYHLGRLPADVSVTEKQRFDDPRSRAAEVFAAAPLERIAFLPKCEGDIK